jgi:ribosomal protein L36
MFNIFRRKPVGYVIDKDLKHNQRQESREEP